MTTKTPPLYFMWWDTEETNTSFMYEAAHLLLCKSNFRPYSPIQRHNHTRAFSKLTPTHTQTGVSVCSGYSDEQLGIEPPTF